VALAHSQINAKQQIGFSQNMEIGFREINLIWPKPGEIGAFLSLQLKQVKIASERLILLQSESACRQLR